MLVFMLDEATCFVRKVRNTLQLLASLAFIRAVLWRPTMVA